MTFLRTISTRRLLALIAVCVTVVVGGTAIAVAASSGGPVPKPEPLAQAVHGALTAPEVTGISARISFTNHLIESSDLGQASSPILTGATGRLWLSTNHQLLRLELQGDNGDAQVVLNGRSFWVYDPSSDTVYRGQLPADTSKHASSGTAATPTDDTVPSIAEIQTDITNLSKHLNLSGAIPGDVAGQPVYTVRVSPQHDGGLLGAIKIGWDAVRGVPLRVAVYAQGDSSPVLELKATDISYGPVAASDFAVSPPVGAKVVTVTVPDGGSNAKLAQSKLAHAKAADTKLARGQRRAAMVTGAAAVAGRLHFSLVAPATLVGLPRHAVRLLDWGGSPAALVTYGENLGGIAVIEQSAPSTATSSSTQGSRGEELQLPTVSINGATGDELDTALGTMIRFTRSGVAYTVLGSVPPVAAEAAARGL
jgi:outer membrane lipoprotein-sorting protein